MTLHYLIPRHYRYDKDWEDVFAYTPVYTNSAGWVWWRKVKRRRVQIIFSEFPTQFFYEYDLPDSPNFG